MIFIHSNASKILQWVLSSLRVLFFAVRNLQAFLLMPAEMDPKAPPEHRAELGTGQPITSQISISLQKTAHGGAKEKAPRKGVMCCITHSRTAVPTFAFQSQISHACCCWTFCTPVTTHHCLFNGTPVPAPEEWSGSECWDCWIPATHKRCFTYLPKSNFSPLALVCQVWKPVQTSKPTAQHWQCGKIKSLADQPNKLVGMVKDRGRRDKVLNLPNAPKCLVRLIYV